jgi:hypothetical protein
VVLRTAGRGGAALVEMRCVLGQYVFEVAPVEDQYSVGQLAADGADPSFGDRIRPALAPEMYQWAVWTRGRTRHWPRVAALSRSRSALGTRSAVSNPLISW